MRHAPLLLILALLPACDCRGSSSDPDAGIDPDATGSDPDASTADVVTCPDPVTPAQSGTCDASGSGANLLLHGTVLGAGTVYENGYVLIEGDEITCVGCDCAGEGGAASARTVSCAGAVISPGLINPHDHLRFTEGAPIDHGATRYDHRHGWRGGLSTPQNPHGTGQNSAGMRWGEARLALSGATGLIGSGRALGMVRNLDDLENDESSRGLREVEFETFPLGDANEQFHADCDWSFRTDELRVAQEPAYLPHVAEGIDDYAAEEFRCQATSMGGGEDFTEPNTAHIHSIGLQAADYYRMALEGAQIIWSPRSNISLYGVTAQVTIFDRLGGTIALGTDWTYSGSANILRELACAADYNRDYLGGHFSYEALWKMVTENAAITADAEHLLGTLEPGKLADVAVFASEPGAHHGAVVTADNEDVALVLKGGVPLVGEADTLSELGESCEAIDVCGAAHAICAQREFGQSWSSLESEVGSAYDAVFCGDPPGEPTCVPSRPGEFDGSTGGGDADGDGIDDGSDNCPTLFNPPRPIDGGSQPDADGDGQGDPCDPTPLPADLDGDGTDNSSDNCPFVANEPQDDADSDDKGDACDPCPQTANPDTVCPEQPPPDVTIAAIQMGTVGTGTHVAIRGVVVTSRFAGGLTVQDPNAGPEYAGIYVFTGGGIPAATIGQRVDVIGDVEEYFQNTELENADVTVLGAGTAITPADITIAEAITEPYEGVLVRVTDISSHDHPYDCADDNPLCADTDLWQANGTGGAILVYDKAYADADWTDHVGETPITGVMMYRFERRRIMPRDASDFGP